MTDEDVLKQSSTEFPNESKVLFYFSSEKLRNSSFTTQLPSCESHDTDSNVHSICIGMDGWMDVHVKRRVSR